jgi:hypothetical protein
MMCFRSPSLVLGKPTSPQTFTDNADCHSRTNGSLRLSEPAFDQLMELPTMPSTSQLKPLMSLSAITAPLATRCLPL